MEEKTNKHVYCFKKNCSRNKSISGKDFGECTEESLFINECGVCDRMIEIEIKKRMDLMESKDEKEASDDDK